MNTEILFAFRTIKKAADTPAQQKVQNEYLKKAYRSYIIARINKGEFYKILYCLEIFRVFLFSIFRIRITGESSDLIYMASTQNQARQIEFVKSLFPDRDFKMFDLRNSKPFGLDFAIYIPALFASFGDVVRYARKVKSNQNTVILTGNILYLCSYAFFRKVLAGISPKAVLVANDHSPLPLGILGAARTLGIKTIYIQHAYITYDLPRLRFDLALLDGQCAVDTYASQGESSTPIVFRGLEGLERPMRTEKLEGQGGVTIGLFLNVFYKEKLMEILGSLEKQARVQRIIIRAHPAHPVSISFSDFSKVELSSAERTLWQDAGECDAVIGGNSSFHLSVLKYGVPTLYYSKLDYINHDDYNFLKYKACYEITTLDNLDFSEVVKFYSDPGWKNRFNYFDASYGYDRQKYNMAIKEAIEKLIV